MKMNICNYKIFSILVVFFFTSLDSQEKPKVAEEAIKGNPIQFINRTNQRASEFFKTVNINDGKDLATEILNKNEATKNNIIAKRIFDPEVERYGADIIILTEKTNFGHINSIIRVLQGYLQNAFEYTPKQAEVLSETIVYYNANLRLNPKNIQDSYSINVINNIDLIKAGIDRSYRNWAGKTQLLIPLRKNIVRPEKTDLDRKEIIEIIEEDKRIPQEKKEELKKIDEEIKKEDIKKIEQKEQEIQKKEEQIEQKIQTVKKEEERIQKELEDTNKRLEELRKDPEKNKEQIVQEEKKVEQLQEQKKEVEQQKQEVQKQQEQVQQEKKEIEEQKKDIQNQQQASRQEEEKKESSLTPATKVDQQLENLKKENEELKKELEKKEELSENVINEKILFMKVLRYIEGGHYNNEIWLLDPNKDDALVKGPFTNICSRTFLPIEKLGIIVIGYEGSSHENSMHNLYLLDPDTLIVKAKSKENIIYSSFLIYRDNSIYAVEDFNGKFYLSRFNEKLELQARSSSNIHPHSEITFFKDKIYLTGSGKDDNIPIQVYDRKDLKLLKVIEPKQTTVSK